MPGNHAGARYQPLRELLMEHMPNRSLRPGAACRRGFTLIELLVVIAIIAILAALLLPVLAGVKTKAHMIQEMSAGRQLTLAVQMYGDDYNNAVFPGYVASSNAVDDQGQPLFFPENARYPWRIVPYLSGSMRLLYSGVNQSLLDQLQSGDHSGYVYSVSLYPSLGMNTYFIGGNQTEFPATAANAKFGDGTVLTRIDQASQPSGLMVFMSARSDVTGSGAQGYYEVTPPYLTSRQWAASYSNSLAPNKWGFVSPRLNGHAVAALLDGHVENFNQQKMQDMRYWCSRANKANWTLGN